MRMRNGSDLGRTRFYLLYSSSSWLRSCHLGQYTYGCLEQREILADCYVKLSFRRGVNKYILIEKQVKLAQGLIYSRTESRADRDLHAAFSLILLRAGDRRGQKQSPKTKKISECSDYMHRSHHVNKIDPGTSRGGGSELKKSFAFQLYF
jgi:hypothetical protein